MQKRKNIDMLRFYGGDVRERTDDGVLIDTCKDDLYSLIGHCFFAYYGL